MNHWRAFSSCSRRLAYTISVLLSLLVLSFIFLTALPAQDLHNPTISYISPKPGASFVLPQSTIIVKSTSPVSNLSLLQPNLFSVEGTISGHHDGRTILADDGITIIFIPNEPYAYGETVSVALHRGAQTQAGNFIEPLSFSFTVSQTEPSMVPITTSMQETDPLLQLSKLSKNLTRSQHSFAGDDSLPKDFPRPSIVTENSPSAGKLFLGTFVFGGTNTHPSYLMILENEGKPVFYRKLAARGLGFTLQPNGYLTYYDYATKQYIELDSLYNIIDTFRCGNGYTTDAHELRLLPNGHALLMAYDNQIVDMSTMVSGGDDFAIVIGLIVQELDREKNVVFEWRSWDHFNITDATLVNFQAATIDYVHGNAIEVTNDGNLLISSRHLDEITKVSRETGEMLWRLGGKNNQFTFINDPVGFSHQHAIRQLPNGNIIFFDNGNGKKPSYSRGVEYKLDEQAKTATMVWQYRHTPDVYGQALGYVQRLPNGNTLISWGATSPALTEVTPDGSTALEIKLPDSVVTYRSYRFQWDGTPIVTSVPDDNLPPSSFVLVQNYPNPFNPSTKIEFSLPRTTDVSLKIFNTLGQEITTLMTGEMTAGHYVTTWDGKNFPSGVYFYRLNAGNFVAIKKMILAK